MTPDSPATENTPRPGVGAVRVIVALYLLAQTALTPLIVMHTSVTPRFLGRFSTSYAALMAIYFAGLAVSVFLAVRWRRLGAATAGAMRRPAFIAATALWWLAMLAAGGIYLQTGDTQFRHLGYLLFSTWPPALAIWRLTPRSARNLADKLALAAATIIALAVIFEIMLWCASPLAPATFKSYRKAQIGYLAFQEDSRVLSSSYQKTMITDDELGWKHVPGAHHKLNSAHDVIEGWTVKTDAWGFLNKDFDPSHQYDVITIGDSFTGEVWPDILKASTGWSVCNLGMSSYGPFQYNVVLRRYALRLKPRCVLYNLYINDTTDATLYEEWRASGQDWFTFMGGMWFGPPPSHPGRNKLKQYLMRFSMIYSLCDFVIFTHSERNVGFLANPIEYEQNGVKLTLDRGSFETLGNLENPRVARGMELVAECLREAKQICDEAAIDLTVFILPCKEWVYFDQMCEAASPEDGEKPGKLVEYYKVLTETCEEAGVEFHDVTDRFRQEANENNVIPYRDIDIHWNPAGSNLMALIARETLEAHYPDLKASAKPLDNGDIAEN